MAAEPPSAARPSSGSHRDWFVSLNTKGDFKPSTLDEYFQTVQGWLRDDMAFLRRPIRSRRSLGNVFRGAAFLALAAGVLLPLPVWDPWWNVDGLKFAYVAVIVGGLLLLLDQTFNISRSWVRLTVSELQMKQVRYRLDLDWAKRRPLLTEQNGADQGPLLIDVLSGAMDAGHLVMTAQATAWTSEMIQALDVLRTRLDADRLSLETVRSQREQERAQPKTGAINIKIENAANLQPPLAISVAGKEEILQTIPATWPVTDVAAGTQKVFLRGKLKASGATFEDGRAVTVTAGGITDTAFEVAVAPAG